jgi:large subunit ribosomal protein L24
MFKIKKGDTVQILKGKDRGKKGKVLEVLSEENRCLIQGLNMVKAFRRKTQQDQQGGVVSMEAPINISNVMLVCKSCNRPSRTGFTVLKDGTKTRICKACKEPI